MDPETVKQLLLLYAGQPAITDPADPRQNASAAFDPRSWEINGQSLATSAPAPRELTEHYIRGGHEPYFASRMASRNARRFELSGDEPAPEPQMILGLHGNASHLPTPAPMATPAPDTREPLPTSEEALLMARRDDLMARREQPRPDPMHDWVRVDGEFRPKPNPRTRVDTYRDLILGQMGRR